MRGVTLPVNTIVIITLSILVLLAVATWFSMEMIHRGRTIDCEEAWNIGCNKWKTFKCNQTRFGDPVPNWDGTIKDACLCARGTDDYETCKKLCCGD